MLRGCQKSYYSAVVTHFARLTMLLWVDHFQSHLENRTVSDLREDKALARFGNRTLRIRLPPILISDGEAGKERMLAQRWGWSTYNVEVTGSLGTGAR